MLTEQQLQQATELFVAACNYNAALHTAFVSTDDMVTVELTVDGKTEKVSIPTYHYLLKQVNALSKQVSQMQITDDGSDVIQLLTTTGNLTLLYLQKQQYYVQPPTNAELLKYDYESMPSPFSSADRTALYIDMSNCKLPMDAQFVIAQFDDQAPMQLPLHFKTTSIDTVANVLSINDDYLLLDSNDLQVGDKVQCHSEVYEVTYVEGQTVKLACTQPTVVKQIVAGDILYSVTDASVAILEVPVCKLAKTLTLQVQYMKLISAKATYDVSDMADAIHQTKLMPLKDVLKGTSSADTMQTVNTAIRPMIANLSEVLQKSTPTIDKITVRQTNTHQYVHSTIETMVKTNAILVQAKQDMQRLEELINETAATLAASGGDVNNDETLLAYNDQLASAKNRYSAAQASLASMNVSAQAVRPEYAATIYCNANDADDMPVVQYVVRYQYLSLSVKDVKNDWLYAYSNKRTINQDGQLSHPIDDYDILNFIQVPIHAYEQLVVQVAAILQYGQPFLTVQTAWTESAFVTIPDDLLQEVSIDEMFKNAYEAKLYTNTQQALESAGVFRHINPNVTYAHMAQDIQYDSNDTVYTKLEQLVRSVNALQGIAGTGTLSIYVAYNGQLYQVSDGAQLSLKAASSYFDSILAGKSGAELADALGSIAEESFQILIVNDTDNDIYLHSMFPGSADTMLTEASYRDIPIIVANAAYTPMEAMALYRSKSNAAGNRTIVIPDASDFSYYMGGVPVNGNKQLSTVVNDNNIMIDINSAADRQKQDAALIVTQCSTSQVSVLPKKIIRDYPGIGIHVGMPYDALNLPDSHPQKNASIAELIDTASHSDLNSLDINGMQAVIGDKFGCELPMQNFDLTALTLAGSGKLAANYIQPGIFNTVDVRADYAGTPYVSILGIGQYRGITCFNPAIHKFLSGRASRGAFAFINPASIEALQLPVYGTSNAVKIKPGQSNAFVVDCKFQARMTDRLGLTDTSNEVVYDADNNVALSNAGGNFSYSKTMNIHIKTGISEVSFDITFTMPFTA